MAKLYLDTIELPGVVDVGNWTVNGNSNFSVLPFSEKVTDLRRKVSALEITQSSPTVCTARIRTVVIEEISTEATIAKLVSYCNTYVGKIGTIKIDSTVIAKVAGVTGCTPSYDHKKGYVISWSFLIINKGKEMQFINKLRNPSFDALTNDSGVIKIEAWTKDVAGTSTVEQVQLFGIEELGDGQSAIKMTTDGTNDPFIYQNINAISGASASDYEDYYWRFSVDAVYQNDELTQESTTAVIGCNYGSSTIYANFSLISGDVQRLSLLVPVKDVYSGGIIQFTIKNKGAAGDVIYFDNAMLEEVSL